MITVVTYKNYHHLRPLANDLVSSHMGENTSLCVYTPKSSQNLCPPLGYSTLHDNKLQFLCLCHVTMCMSHKGDLTVSSVQEEPYFPGGTVSTLLLKRVH